MTSLLRLPMMPRLLRFAVATSSSSAMALLAILVLARALDESEFVVVNLAIVLGTLAAQTGSGFDSASARLLSQDRLSLTDALRHALAWRVVTGGLALVFPVLAAILVAVDGREAQVAALAAAAGLGFGMSALSLALIEPQASGSPRAFGTRQFSYYLPLLLGAGAAAVLGETVPALCCLAATGVLAALILYARFLRSSRSRSHVSAFGSSDYRRIAGTIAFSGILFTLGERVDLVAATAFFPIGDAADYAAAARLTVVLALLVSAFQTLNISVMGRARTLSDLDAALVGQKRNILALAGAALFTAVCAWAACPLVFGPSYSPGLFQLALLSAPFVLYAVYSPYALAMAALGFQRQLLVTSAAGVLTKLVIVAVAVATESLTLLYASGLIAAAASLAATIAYRRSAIATHAG